ncbi:hypothetical protein CN444_29880 [Bacillus thuringiensis]|nr:hypothetical protein CN444_29880 [Bacillus thuringiensis]
MSNEKAQFLNIKIGLFNIDFLNIVNSNFAGGTHDVIHIMKKHSKSSHVNVGVTIHAHQAKILRYPQNENFIFLQLKDK